MALSPISSRHKHVVSGVALAGSGHSRASRHMVLYAKRSNLCSKMDSHFMNAKLVSYFIKHG